MRKEKYIVERYSSKSGKKKELISLQVCIHFNNNGERKCLTNRFRLADYDTPTDAMNAAKAWRDYMLIEISKHNDMEKYLPCDMTVNDINSYIDEYHKRSKTTMIMHDKLFKKYIKPEYGNKKIVDITKADIYNSLNSCADHCTKMYVRNLKTAWRYIIDIAVQKNILSRNIVDDIVTPKSKRVTERSCVEQNISEEDFEKFCEAFYEYGHYLPDEVDKLYNRDMCLRLIKLLRITGLRSQEARALRKANIEVLKKEDGTKYGYVYVTSSVGSTLEETDIITATKTPQSRRIIPVFGDGVGLLEEIVAKANTEFVFAKYNGNLLTTTEFSDYLNRVSKACGIKVYATLLRKSFAADLYRNGVNPVVTKKLMGHESENMSLNWYATVSDKEVFETMENRAKYYKKE